MLFSSGTVAAVSSIAFHQSPVHFLYKVLNKFRSQVIALGGFPGGNLHGYASACLNAHGFINLYQAFRRDAGSIVHCRGRRIRSFGTGHFNLRIPILLILRILLFLAS